VLYFCYRAIGFFWKRSGPAASATGEASAPSDKPAGKISSVDKVMLPGMWILAAGVFAAAIITSSEWALAARLMPQTVSAVGLLVVTCAGIGVYVRRRAGETIIQPREVSDLSPLDALEDRQLYARMGVMLAWVLSILVGTVLIGLLPMLFVFMVGFMRVEGNQSWFRTLAIALGMWVSMFILFDQLLVMPWPQSYLGDFFPELRSMVSDII
jgi:hypothetical protein